MNINKTVDEIVPSIPVSCKHGRSELKQVSLNRQADVSEFNFKKNDSTSLGDHSGQEKLLTPSSRNSAIGTETSRQIPPYSQDQSLLFKTSEVSSLKSIFLRKLTALCMRLKIPGQWEIDRLVKTQRRGALQSKKK